MGDNSNNEPSKQKRKTAEDPDEEDNSNKEQNNDNPVMEESAIESPTKKMKVQEENRQEKDHITSLHSNNETSGEKRKTIENDPDEEDNPLKEQNNDNLVMEENPIESPTKKMKVQEEKRQEKGRIISPHSTNKPSMEKRKTIEDNPDEEDSSNKEQNNNRVMEENKTESPTKKMKVREENRQERDRVINRSPARVEGLAARIVELSRNFERLNPSRAAGGDFNFVKPRNVRPSPRGRGAKNVKSSPTQRHNANKVRSSPSVEKEADNVDISTASGHNVKPSTQGPSTEISPVPEKDAISSKSTEASVHPYDEDTVEYDLSESECESDRAALKGEDTKNITEPTDKSSQLQSVHVEREFGAKLSPKSSSPSAKVKQSKSLETSPRIIEKKAEASDDSTNATSDQSFKAVPPSQPSPEKELHTPSTSRIVERRSINDSPPCLHHLSPSKSSTSVGATGQTQKADSAKSSSSTSPNKCLVCRKSFANPKLLSEHKIHGHFKDPEKKTCQTCHKEYTNFDSYDKHVKSHLKSPRKKKTTPEKKETGRRASDETEIVCPICNSKFCNASDYQEHMRDEHPGV